MIISEKIDELVKKIAATHAEIIENKCKEVIDKFNCDPKDLIIEYHDRTLIKIKVMASEFIIENIYTINGMPVEKVKL